MKTPISELPANYREILGLDIPLTTDDYALIRDITGSVSYECELCATRGAVLTPNGYFCAGDCR